jgi:hypothetical protein
MKEQSEKLIGQKAKDDATMNFVSKQAQEAILDPNIPNSYKDEIVGAAVGTILRIAERRNRYEVTPRKRWGLERDHTIYQAEE